jgi:hypothetical protein
MSTGWTRELCEKRIKWSYKMLTVCHFTIIFSVIGMCICIRISGATGGMFLWVIFGVAVAIFFGTLIFLWGVVIEIGNRNYHLKELELDEMAEAKRQKNKKTQKPTNPDSIIKGAI